MDRIWHTEAITVEIRQSENVDVDINLKPMIDPLDPSKPKANLIGGVDQLLPRVGDKVVDNNGREGVVSVFNGFNGSNCLGSVRGKANVAIIRSL